MGIEPTSPAWKAGVIAIIRQPQMRRGHIALLLNSSNIYTSVSTVLVGPFKKTLYNLNMKRLVYPLGFFLLILLTTCLSKPPASFKIAQVGKNDADMRVLCLPGSVKILETELPHSSFNTELDIHAAKGEGESRQVLMYAGTRELKNINIEFEWEDASLPIPMELRLVDYTIVKKPGLRSFGRRGRFPDPLVPLQEFSIEAKKNRILHITCNIPRTAETATHSGGIKIWEGEEGRKELLATVPVTLTVWPVELPVTSFLKTSIHFRLRHLKEERYYGEAWVQENMENLHQLALSFRFSSRPNLPWQEAVEQEDWQAFDGEFLKWRERGLTAFEVYVPFRMRTSREEMLTSHLPSLAKLNAHLLERGWQDYFYLYFFDEPAIWEIDALKKQMLLIQEWAPNIRQLYTYGTNRSGEKKLRGLAGIWVPNIHQYNPRFARERQEAGDEYWIYTCIGNVHRGYPDNFRIDWYGASHRALGWWLFKNNIDGYLYWGLDYWRIDPWTNAETYPWANGDGSMFYPDPDKKALPFPSLRLHAMRDGFEDFDLLHMLEKKVARRGFAYKSETVLLQGLGLLEGKKHFSTDDTRYDEYHRLLLQALATDTVEVDN